MAILVPSPTCNKLKSFMTKVFELRNEDWIWKLFKGEWVTGKLDLTLRVGVMGMKRCK